MKTYIFLLAFLFTVSACPPVMADSVVHPSLTKVKAESLGGFAKIIKRLGHKCTKPSYGYFMGVDHLKRAVFCITCKNRYVRSFKSYDLPCFYRVLISRDERAWVQKSDQTDCEIR